MSRACPPGFHINPPRGGGTLCRTLPLRAWALPAGLPVGLKLRCNSRTQSLVGVRSCCLWFRISRPCSSVLGGGLVCICGPWGSRREEHESRARPKSFHSACTTPLGSEGPTLLNVNGPQEGVVLCFDSHFNTRWTSKPVMKKPQKCRAFPVWCARDLQGSG